MPLGLTGPGNPVSLSPIGAAAEFPRSLHPPAQGRSGTVEIELREEGAIRIVSLKGRLDAQVSGLVRERLQKLIEEGAVSLILNLEAVDFLDSSGLGVVVAGLRKIKENKGEIKLAGLRPEVRSIFDITRVTRLFQICADVPTALEAFRKPG